MREQDKMLYLQFVKLQTAMKEVRNELQIFEDNLDDSIFGPICQCKLFGLCGQIFQLFGQYLVV